MVISKLLQLHHCCTGESCHGIPSLHKVQFVRAIIIISYTKLMLAKCGH